jgi:hypothetical protein
LARTRSDRFDELGDLVGFHVFQGVKEASIAI